MNPKHSPFTANTFQKIWKKHFIPDRLIKSFKIISGTSFYKHKFIPLYFNIGKNLTKGNIYKLQDAKDYKNKTFLIYDVFNNSTIPS